MKFNYNLIQILFISIATSNYLENKNASLDNKIELNSLYYEFDSEIIQLEKCNNDILFVLTEKYSLYKTNSSGMWKKLNDILISKAIDSNESSEVDKLRIGNVMKIIPNENYIIFMGSLEFFWISENCSDQFIALKQPLSTIDIIPHPTEKKWILLISHTNQYKELHISMNMGYTWKVISKYIVQVGWAYNKINNNIPKERILLTYDPKGRGQQITKGWNYKVDFVYSDNFLNSVKIGIRKGNKFLLTNNFIFVHVLYDFFESLSFIRLIYHISKI